MLELDAMLRRIPGRVAVRVLFVQPAGVSEDWTRTDLWRASLAIPGAQAIADPHGAELARFGSLTSGDIALYDRTGRLRFSGGVTGARGHLGPNPGADRLKLALDDVGHGHRSPVFGCPLFSPPSTDRTKERL